MRDTFSRDLRRHSQNGLALGPQTDRYELVVTSEALARVPPERLRDFLTTVANNTSVPFTAIAADLAPVPLPAFGVQVVSPVKGEIGSQGQTPNVLITANLTVQPCGVSITLRAMPQVNVEGEVFRATLSPIDTTIQLDPEKSALRLGCLRQYVARGRALKGLANLPRLCDSETSRYNSVKNTPLKSPRSVLCNSLFPKELVQMKCAYSRSFYVPGHRGLRE